MPAFVFETTPKIICEQGGSHRLGEFAAGLDMQRVFVVTDKGCKVISLFPAEDLPIASKY